MSLAHLGVFEHFWDEHAHHLPLLNLIYVEEESTHCNLGVSLSRIDEIILNNSRDQVEQGIKALLVDHNWRPHLVACVAILKMDPECQVQLVEILWKRLEDGSWVSPQILVTLSFVDPNFGKKATHIKTTHPKVVAAAQYLLNGTINDNQDNEFGGSITRKWKEKILILKEKGKI